MRSSIPGLMLSSDTVGIDGRPLRQFEKIHERRPQSGTDEAAGEIIVAGESSTREHAYGEYDSGIE